MRWGAYCEVLLLIGNESSPATFVANVLRIFAVSQECYEPAARFGTYEIWRRKPGKREKLPAIDGVVAVVNVARAVLSPVADAWPGGRCADAPAEHDGCPSARRRC